MIEDLQNYKKIGWLLIICGVWNAILGFLFGYGFIFSSFDIGDGYDKVGELYKTIAYHISWFGMILFGIGGISSVFSIVGGIFLLRTQIKKWFLDAGLNGMYFYFVCFGVITCLLSLSGGAVVTSLIWIGVGVVILLPSFLLHRTLRRLG